MSMDLPGVRILVVDDRPDSLALLAEVLALFGAETRTALSADAALHELNSFTPDVVVSDLEMPGKDGYRLLAELRAQGVTAPVIAATGNPADHRRRAAAAGFAAFISKPSPIDVVADVVRSVLEPSTP
jgi:CheY-like chemotaxis protein